MSATDRFTVREADWCHDQAAIRAVRDAVFIVEQGIPAALEWDDLDADCRHVLASNDAGDPVATGRLTPEGRIGRMAVLPAWRGCGIGRALLARLLQLAGSRGLTDVCLHAQHAAAGFYRRAGFRESGAPFALAGIVHVKMTRSIDP
ncbi:MAG: GNAT family N-acetyltransferase [Gammaproteobacteria bacterium]